MQGDRDVNYSLICAVRDGRLERTRELINSYGLSHSRGGYCLLYYALANKHTEVAKFLLTSGCKVCSESEMPFKTPLHFAVHNGDIEITKLLLDKGADINAKNQSGITPLHKAILNNAMEVAELLLKHGADVNARDNDGASPLHNAIKNETIKVTELLLRHGADVNAKNNYGACPLHVAAEKGSLQIVEQLLKHNPYLNWPYTSGWKRGYTPLHIAVEKGSKEIVTLLLSSGAFVDVTVDDDKTPLHIAAEKGFVHIAEDLIQYGASNRSSTLKKGYTPLHFASALDNEEAVNFFLNNGADINGRTNDNLTPLHIATKTGRKKVVKLLLEHGAKVDDQDKDGKTTLHFAVKNGYLTIVEDVLKYSPDINHPSNRSSLKIAVVGDKIEYKNIAVALLEYGFIVDPKDANNPELLHAAVEKGYLKIIEDQLKFGADVNMLYSSTGFTPIHSPAKNKQEEVAKLLINYKADINAHDKTEKTPIFYAIENADLKITKLLLTNGAKIKDSPDLLSFAVKKKCIEIVKALLQHDADINGSDEYGRTALHFTALIETKRFFESPINEDPDDINLGGEIAKLLLSKGANVDAKQKDGMTALHMAALNGHKEVVKNLLEYGAKVDSKFQCDITPLHLAAKNGHREIVETFLKFGANIDSRDDYGCTALHIASQEGYYAVVATLLDYGSDVNITSRYNRTPIDHADGEMRPFLRHYYVPNRGDRSSTVTDETLKRHIVKMKTANLYVSEENLLRMRSSGDEISDDFQDECEEEISRMKVEKINCNCNISFYDILSKGATSLAKYTRNENLVQVLKSNDYKTKFPMYAGLIEGHFRMGMIRKELLERGNAVSHLLFNNFPELPYDCTENILSFLSNEDLRILVVACKPPNIPNTY